MKFVYTAGNALTELEFDAVVREKHESTVEITSHPVETGGEVTDHVAKQPDRLSCDARVTNTPVTAPTTNMRGVTGSVQSKQYSVSQTKRNDAGQVETGTLTFGANVLQFDGPFDRVRDIHAELRRLQESATLLSVQTLYRGGLIDYENMIIQGLTAPREVKDGYGDGIAITFSFDLVTIQFVDTQIVATPAPKLARKSRGKQGKKELDSEKDAQKESIAHQLVGKLIGALN